MVFTTWAKASRDVEKFMKITRRQALLGSALGIAAAPAVLVAASGAAQAASPSVLNREQVRGKLLAGVVFEDATLAAARLKFIDSAGTVTWRVIGRSGHGKDGVTITTSDPFMLPENVHSVELDPGFEGRARLGAVEGTLSPSAGLRRSASNGTIDFLGSPVVPRSAWGADESLMTWAPQDFSPTQILTVHHSAMVTDTKDVASTVRGIYKYHAVTNGWGDIGYQLLIGPDGTVFAGRSTGSDQRPVFQAPPVRGQLPASVTAAHSGGFNTGNIGICVLGDFTSKGPTPLAFESLVNMLARLCQVAQLNPLSGLKPFPLVDYRNPVNGAAKENPAISRHRDWNSTECPGNTFAEWFGQVRMATKARMVGLRLQH